MRVLRSLLFTVLACVGLAFSLAACEQDAEQTTETYLYTERNRDGIGKFYLGREISYVMGHQGAAWLERPERVREERTDLLIKNLPLEEGDTIADIGAGTGYFSFPLARAVGESGRVYAVDIQPEMLQFIEDRKKVEAVSQVVPILATSKSPELPAESIDLALFVDVYHELEWPLEVMTALVESIKPGGKVVLVEYKAEMPRLPIARLHKMTAEQAELEMAAVGLYMVDNIDVLPRQHLLIFSKPEDSGPE